MRRLKMLSKVMAPLLVLACGSDGEGGDGAATDAGTVSATGTPTAGDDGDGDGDPAGDSTAMGQSAGSDDATESGTADDGDDANLPFTCNGFTPTDDGDADGVVCFYDVDNPGGEPAASLMLSEVDLNGTPSVYVQLIFAPWFVDNTYGTEVIGWDQHTFKDLDGSDHAIIPMSNAGETDPLLVLKLDYVDEDDTAPSGYRCLGVWGGEGSMEVGDPAAVLAANSSLSRNLNERGHSTYTTDSPATDADYTPNPATPDWDYRVIYEAWVDASLFADVNAIDACIDSIHASPAKIGDNTVDVIPDECPPGWGCFTTGKCDECTDPTDPDAPSTCDPGDGFPPVP